MKLTFEQIDVIEAAPPHPKWNCVDIDKDALQALCHYARIGLLSESDIAEQIKKGTMTSADHMELDEYRKLYGHRFVDDVVKK